MSEEKKLSKFEKLAMEYDTTIGQINGLYLKLTIWELETGVDLSDEKNEVMQLRLTMENKLKEYKNEEK
jgi:hypothetical protein